MNHDKQNSPAARQLAVFPLLVGWRKNYWSLPLYFPNLAVGEMAGAPAGVGLPTLPLPPVKKSLEREWRSYHPGELSQWGVYQNFLDSQDEGKDLLQSIRGNRPAPLPTSPDPALIWTLARQLEKMRVEQEEILQQTDRQQCELDTILAPDPWDEESQLLAASWQKASLGLASPPDPELTKLRLLFWRMVLDSHLRFPYTPLVLESPRTMSEIKSLIESESALGDTYQAQIILPACESKEELEKAKETLIKAGLADSFTQGLQRLLGAAARGQAAFAAAQAALEEMIAQQLRPMLETSLDANIIIDFSQRMAGGQDWPHPVQEVLSGPMLFWLPG
jgi:cell pole-organizing protein PopZ